MFCIQLISIFLCAILFSIISAFFYHRFFKCLPSLRITISDLFTAVSSSSTRFSTSTHLIYIYHIGVYTSFTILILFSKTLPMATKSFY